MLMRGGKRFAKKNLHDALRGREQTGHRFEQTRKSSGVEQRCSYGLDELVGLEHPAASSVILGFSAQGEHVIAYACHSNDGEADGFDQVECLEYVLEFWRFNFHSPLVCTGRIPIFRCSDATNFGMPEFAECQHAKISMVESLHPSALLVAGSGTHSEDDSEEQPSRRESISVLLGYTGCMSSMPEADILVLHLTYLKRPPYPPLQLTRCLVSSGASGSPLPLSVVLNTGDTIRVVSVVDKFAPRAHEPFGEEHDVEARIERLASRGGEEDCTNIEIVQGCFDAEEYLSQLLSSLNSSNQLPPGNYHVADYDLELVEASSECFSPLKPSDPASTQPSAAAHRAAPDDDQEGGFLASDAAHRSLQASSADVPASHSTGACAAVGLVAVLEGSVGSAQSHVMVGHLLLLDLCSGAVLHRLSTKIQPCHPHVLAAPSPLAKRFAASWQAALKNPQVEAHRTRNLLVLDNDSVHAGRSVPILPNRRYPVDITPPT